MTSDVLCMGHKPLDSNKLQLIEDRVGWGDIKDERFTQLLKREDSTGCLSRHITNYFLNTARHRSLQYLCLVYFSLVGYCEHTIKDVEFMD